MTDFGALKNGSRLRVVSKPRSDLAVLLVEEYGLSMAESARLLGVSTSAIAKVITRDISNKS
jgi:putative transposase